MMIGDAIFTEDFLKEVEAENPHIEKIRTLIIEAYNKETGANFDINKGFSQKDELGIRTWLNRVHLDNPKSVLLSHKKVSVLLPFFSTTLSEKILSVSQFNCPLCTDGESFPIVYIPIRIAAISKQAVAGKPETRAAFEKAIRFRLSDYQDKYQKGTKLCILVVFILGKANRDKDLDNMSKALLDALNQVLFSDDRDIDHLSLIKTKHPGKESFIKINIRKSSLNLHRDVLIKSFHHGWGGAQFLDLKDFM